MNSIFVDVCLVKNNGLDRTQRSQELGASQVFEADTAWGVGFSGWFNQGLALLESIDQSLESYLLLYI